MAKARTAPIAEVSVRYDLSELPTAQHKAGLAGLVLAIRSLRECAANNPDAEVAPGPEITEGPTATAVTIRFTEATTQALFNDLYDAKPVEVASKTKWQGQEPKRVDEAVEEDAETRKVHRVKRFIYDQIQPVGRFLQQHLPTGMPANRDWIKLWRDMLWRIPRGNPQSREPYEQRLAGLPCKEGATAWKDLLNFEKARQSNCLATREVAGSLWLGAQAVNAENVSFMGRVDYNLLLHFWQLTAFISVPQKVKHDGTQEFVGFVLAIPEVADLKVFVNRFPRMLASLPTEVRGYRPAHAVIDLPAQGALEFINSVAKLKTAEQVDRPLRAVSSVEFLHLEKIERNVKLLTSGRIPSDERMLSRYQDLVGSQGKRSRYRNPLFRAALLDALLRDKEWWSELLALFMEEDWRFFVRASDTKTEAPKIASLPWFWNDARLRLQADSDAFDRLMKEGTPMGDSPSDPDKSMPLSALINRLVRRYVYRRAQERSGVQRSTKDVDRKALPAEFKEEREHVAKSLFLEFRSRRDRAFVEHFAQTLFAVKQFLKDEDQLQLSHALLNQTDDVKTLTLIALSANS